jgi:hypothetical protein
MLYLSDDTKEKFSLWWANKSCGKPLIRLMSQKEKIPQNFTSVYGENHSNTDWHINPDLRVRLVKEQTEYYDFLAQAFPYVDLNIGPGSMCVYLGCRPNFSRDTVWYDHLDAGLEDLVELDFRKSSHWWDIHVNAVTKAVELAGGQFPVAIPDIQEGIDILSAMRGPQQLCFDLIDCPETVMKVLDRLDGCFYYYYDKMYDICKCPDNSSVFTAFSIWGKGKTAKIQCDFSALISPDIFDEFVLPYLKKQCDYLDNAMYHLDGPMAIRHVDSLMKIEKLKALQWTSGAGEDDGGSEKWFGLYDKVKDANKALWIELYKGDCYTQVERAKKILKRYGPDGIYFIFGYKDKKSAEYIMSQIG